VYLGRSPQHARDVSFVLNLETGLAGISPVSCQAGFYIDTEGGVKMPLSLWLQKYSFVAHAPSAKSSPKDSVTRTDKTTEAFPPADHEGDSPDEDPQNTQREPLEDPEEQPDVLPLIR